MAISVIHHRKPAGQPLNTSRDYCGLCWTPPGREHGFACPAVKHRPHPDAIRAFRGVLIGLPLGAALWAAGAALIGAIA